MTLSTGNRSIDGEDPDREGDYENDEGAAPAPPARRPPRGKGASRRPRQQGVDPAAAKEAKQEEDDLPPVAHDLLRLLNAGSSRTGPLNHDTARMFASYYESLTRDRYKLQEWLTRQGYNGPLVNRCVEMVFGLKDLGQDTSPSFNSQTPQGYQWTPNGFMPMPIFMSGGGDRSGPQYQPPIIFPPASNSQDVDRLRDDIREQLREERDRYQREIEVSTSRLEASILHMTTEFSRVREDGQKPPPSNVTYRRFRRPRLDQDGAMMTDADGRDLFDEIEEPYDLETERLKAQMEIIRQVQPPPSQPQSSFDVEGLFSRLTEKMEFQRELDRQAHQRELDEIKHSIELQSTRVEAERQAAERVRLEEVRPLEMAYREASAMLAEAQSSKDLPPEEVARQDTLNRVERVVDKAASRFDSLFDKFDQQQRYSVAAQAGLTPTGRVDPVPPERQQEILDRVRARAMGQVS